MAFALSQYSMQPLYADLLPTALSRLPIAVSIYDNDENLAFANDAYLRLWNFPSEMLEPENNAQRLALQLALLEAGMRIFSSALIRSRLRCIRSALKMGASMNCLQCVLCLISGSRLR